MRSRGRTAGGKRGRKWEKHFGHGSVQVGRREAISTLLLGDGKRIFLSFFLLVETMSSGARRGPGEALAVAMGGARNTKGPRGLKSTSIRNIIRPQNRDPSRRR